MIEFRGTTYYTLTEIMDKYGESQEDALARIVKAHLRGATQLMLAVFDNEQLVEVRPGFPADENNQYRYQFLSTRDALDSFGAEHPAPQPATPPAGDVTMKVTVRGKLSNELKSDVEIDLLDEPLHMSAAPTVATADLVDAVWKARAERAEAEAARYTHEEIEALLDDYDKTNRFMFTDDMSKFHAAAPAVVRQLLDDSIHLKKLLKRLSDLGVDIDV